MARFFKSGSLHQEVVATYDSGDIVVLVTIERVRAGRSTGTRLVSTGYAGLSSRRQRMGTRACHADPLVNDISLEQAAALARGDKK